MNNNLPLCGPPGGKLKAPGIKGALRRGVSKGTAWLTALLLGILLIPAAVCLGAIGIFCSLLEFILNKFFKRN